MTDSQKPSKFQELALVVESLPAYALLFIANILIAICSNAPITSLALGSVAFGIATGLWWLAVAIFFLLYVVVYAINNIANAIGNGSRGLSQSVSMHSQVLASRLPIPDPPTDA